MSLLDEADAVARLEAVGIKATAQRTLIARILLSGPQHLSAEQVLNRLERLGSRCSRATVYNTLGLFERSGLVREVVVDASRAFFDSTPGPHHHLYNVDTGEIRDIDLDAIAVTGMPALPEGTEHEGTDIVLRVRNTR